MSRKYKFHNPSNAYFVSFATVHWIDVFTREAYSKLWWTVLLFVEYKRIYRCLPIVLCPIMYIYFLEQIMKIPASASVPLVSSITIPNKILCTR